MVNPDPWLRATVRHAVGLSGQKRWHKELQRGMQDENPVVRESSILALVRLDGHEDESLARLLEQRAADDPDELVREAAGLALKAIGAVPSGGRARGKKKPKQPS